MGGGSFSASEYHVYSCSMGKTIDAESGFITSGQEYKSTHLDEALNPKGVIRECANSEEHPNTIPVILALDVTGSMGSACKKTAEALGVIMKDLYEKYENIEFMIMGIGDLEYDTSPIQASQFESDVRIAENLDKLYLEGGGGSNSYESYTAAWYFGLYKTKLDAFDKQGRKGIIITLGDEPLNPYLPIRPLKYSLGNHQVNEAVCTASHNVDTNSLYKEASKKFDIYHISIDDPGDSYSHWASRIDDTFGKLLGENAKVCGLNSLNSTIVECISDSISKNEISSINEGSVETPYGGGTKVNEKGEIFW